MAVLAAGTAVFLSAAGVTGAYLTDAPEKLENLITLGSIKVALEEPDWKEEKARGLTPGSVVPKNPAAVNTGKSDSWIFLKVEIPVKRISLVDAATKQKQEPAEAELFSFTLGEKWELIEKETKSGQAVYVYGYGSIVRPGERTKELFQNVTLVNYLEGELEETDILNIPVEAMSVQTGICGEGAGLKEIYSTYLAQKAAEKEAEEEGGSL